MGEIVMNHKVIDEKYYLLYGSWIDNVICVNEVLDQGKIVYWNEGGYIISETVVSEMQYLKNKCNLKKMERGDVGELFALRKLKIAVYGIGAALSYAKVLNATGFEWLFINETEIRTGVLDGVDVLIMPGGGLESTKGQLYPLGEKGINEIQRFVREGGLYLASCSGAFSAGIVNKRYYEQYPISKNMELINAKIWNINKDHDEWSGQISLGIGRIKVQKSINHPITWQMPNEFEVTYYNGPVFCKAEDYSVEGASRATEILAWSGIGKLFTPSEKWYNANQAEDNSCLYQEAIKYKLSDCMYGYLDQGKVVVFGSHPEFGDNILMDNICISSKMIINVLFWHAATSARRISHNEKKPMVFKRSTVNFIDIENIFQDKINELDFYITLVKSINTEKMKWLSNDINILQFNKKTIDIWKETIIAIDKIEKDICYKFKEIKSNISDSWLDENINENLYLYFMYERENEWNQDFGYQGFFKYIDMAMEFFECALVNLDFIPQKETVPYNDFEKNPYLLIAGIYTSASGCISNANILLDIFMKKAGITEKENKHEKTI